MGTVWPLVVGLGAFELQTQNHGWPNIINIINILELQTEPHGLSMAAAAIFFIFFLLPPHPSFFFLLLLLPFLLFPFLLYMDIDCPIMSLYAFVSYD